MGAHGLWIYALLFAIVFAQTGVVATPFLPGDSLLFAVGALCASGALAAPAALPLLVLAACLGNAANYAVGRHAGRRLFGTSGRPARRRWRIDRARLVRAQGFFDRYGGKAVVLGPFVPVVRTFVPFVAGAAGMRSDAFALCAVVGASAWVGSRLGAGLLFGNVPVVRENFALATVAVVLLSVLPALIEYLRRRALRSPSSVAGSRGRAATTR